MKTLDAINHEVWKRLPQLKKEAIEHFHELEGMLSVILRFEGDEIYTDISNDLLCLGLQPINKTRQTPSTSIINVNQLSQPIIGRQCDTVETSTKQPSTDKTPSTNVSAHENGPACAHEKEPTPLKGGWISFPRRMALNGKPLPHLDDAEPFR